MPIQRLPSILAVPFSRQNDGVRIELLTPEEKAAIAEISRVIELRRNTVIYPEGGRCEFVYNIISGLIETYRLLPGGERRITSFLFPADLAGLSEGGDYVGTAQAISPVVAFKIPYTALERLVRRDPKLDVALLCKLCSELRQSERHLLINSQKEASARVASFLLWLRSYESPETSNQDQVHIPMLRYDIADYLGLTVESVSRAFHELERLGLINRLTPRQVRIMDLPRLSLMSRES